MSLWALINYIILYYTNRNFYYFLYYVIDKTVKIIGKLIVKIIPSFSLLHLYLMFTLFSRQIKAIGSQ